MSTSELTVQASLHVPGLPVLDLCADHTRYRLEAASREERAVSFRKQEVDSPFVEGSYLISAVRENVLETVSVWVRGVTQAELSQRVDDLCMRLEAPRFVTHWGYDGLREEWDCQAASYTVRSQREFQHAKVALVKAQIPRLPRVRVTRDGVLSTR